MCHAERKPPDEPADVELCAKASGFFKLIKDCDWQLDKRIVNIDTDTSRGILPIKQLPRGGCVSVTYNIHADRTCFTKTRAFGVSGQVCVFNQGEVPTRGLAISGQIQEQEEGQDWKNSRLGRFDVDVTDDTPGDRRRDGVPPCDSECFNYSVSFPPNFQPDPNKRLRIVFTATWRQKGCKMDGCTATDTVEFCIPPFPTESDIVDECATIEDDESNLCEKVSCNPDPSTIGPWQVCSANLSCPRKCENDECKCNFDVQFTKRLCNDICKLKCDKNTQLCNLAQLTEGDSGKQKWDMECLPIKVKCNNGRGMYKNKRPCDDHDDSDWNDNWWKDWRKHN
jgi:hypothetical protein